MCPRCRGRLATHLDEPTCMVCGWVSYGEPAEIAERARHSRRAHVRNGSTHRNDTVGVRPRQVVHNWDYAWEHKGEAGTIRVEYSSVGKTATAMSICGWPSSQTPASMLMSRLRAAFAHENSMRLMAVRDCFAETGMAGWAERRLNA